MAGEISILNKIYSWDLVHLPQGKCVIESCWYTRKKKSSLMSQFSSCILQLAAEIYYTSAVDRAIVPSHLLDHEIRFFA